MHTHTLTHTCTHTASRDDKPVKEGVPSGHSPGAHGAGRENYRSSRPPPHPLRPSTTPLHTPHRGKCGRSPARKCVWVGGWVWGGDLLAVCVRVVLSQVNHTSSEVIPHYVFMLLLSFTSGQPSLVGYTGTPPPLSNT